MAESALVFEGESEPHYIPERFTPEDEFALPTTWTASRLMSEFGNFSLIARGGYGVVFKANNINDGSEYAIKLIYHGLMNDALTEVRVHAQLNHCNIVNYKTCWVESSSMELQDLLPTSSDGFTSDSAPATSESLKSSGNFNWDDSCSHVCFNFSEDSRTLVPCNYEQNPEKMTLIIQMEFCGKTLRDWLDTPRPCDVSRKLWFTYRRLRALIMFWDIMNGTEHIHLKGFVHHDIKPSNIFVMDGGGIKIGDFGLACWQNNSSKVHHCIGTESYAAPEQFHGGDCSSKSDIFSAGLILLEMLLSPFDTVSERHAVLQNLRTGQVPDMISVENEDLGKLIKDMSCKDLHMRPTASEVKDTLITLMIPIAEEMYSELMKALTASIVRKLYLSDSNVQAAPESASARFMLDILDDLTCIGFIQPSQYRDVQDNLGCEQSSQARTESELKRQKELKVKVMLQNKLGRYSRVAGL